MFYVNIDILHVFYVLKFGLIAKIMTVFIQVSSDFPFVRQKRIRSTCLRIMQHNYSLNYYLFTTTNYAEDTAADHND